VIRLGLRDERKKERKRPKGGGGEGTKERDGYRGVEEQGYSGGSDHPNNVTST